MGHRHKHGGSCCKVRLYDLDGDGLTDSWESALRTMANDVYNGIAEQGAI